MAIGIKSVIKQGNKAYILIQNNTRYNFSLTKEEEEPTTREEWVFYIADYINMNCNIWVERSEEDYINIGFTPIRDDRILSAMQEYNIQIHVQLLLQNPRRSEVRYDHAKLIPASQFPHPTFGGQDRNLKYMVRAGSFNSGDKYGGGWGYKNLSVSELRDGLAVLHLPTYHGTTYDPAIRKYLIRGGAYYKNVVQFAVEMYVPALYMHSYDPYDLEDVGITSEIESMVVDI